MTDADRRIASVAAAFAPERAPGLVARMSGTGASGSVSHAARVAAAPRYERLLALSAALTFAVDPAHVEAAARLERPAVAAVMRALAADERAAPSVSPVIVRLCRERIGR